MSDSQLPEYVDARKIFDQEGALSGHIDLTKLDRLKGCLSGEEATIKAEVSFFVDDFGRKHITGWIEAGLQVECQRCLGPLTIELKDDINLVLVADETAAKNLEDEFDPWIIEENKIFLADLIDEQLVLSMPIVNYHRSRSCSVQPGYISGDDKIEKGAGTNPFAVLASLRKQ